jgi:apolipoprotein N-acyltransferase
MKKLMSILRRPALACLTAGLLLLCYEPAGWSFLVWVALVPLLACINTADKLRRGVFESFICGYVFFVVGLLWLRHVTWAGLFILSIIMAAYFALFALMLMMVPKERPMLRIIAAPVIWTAVEWLRAWLFSGFPWFQLGHSQHANVTLIQIADITGVYGVTFLIVAFNAVLCAAFLKFRKEANWGGLKNKALAAAFGVCVVLLGGVIVYGLVLSYAYEKTHPHGPRIAVVQGNIPQSAKEQLIGLRAWYDKHVLLSFAAMGDREAIKDAKNRFPNCAIDLDIPADGKYPDVDMLVWAETMFPPMSPDASKDVEALQGTAKMLGARTMLAGMLTDERTDAGGDCYNSAYFLDSSGKVLGRYDKMHLVIVSEYVPGKGGDGIIGKIARKFSNLEEIGRLTPGRNATVFEMPAAEKTGGNADTCEREKFASLICFEILFPELARDATRNGADFIVTISNDAWFKDSAELEQITGIAVFRAVENRRTVIRATNSGISAFIWPTGEMDTLRGASGRKKEIEGILVRQVRTCWGSSFYSRHGDVFAVACAAAAVALTAWGFIATFFLTRKRPQI